MLPTRRSDLVDFMSSIGLLHLYYNYLFILHSSSATRSPTIIHLLDPVRASEICW